jgi:putative phosphoribosyl transferase
MGDVRILSTSSTPFADRREAGRLLAEQLTELRGRRAVVLGIPRGGVVVAWELARALEADLDIVLSRKLGAPGNPELAIGALSETGDAVVDEFLNRRLGVSEAYIDREKQHQMAEIERRTHMYRAIRPRVPLAGRTVVVTDDGLATGATMQAALRTVRHEAAEEVIAAVPVGPDHSVRDLAPLADRVLCLRSPAFFAAVGEFYVRFDQTSDEEVLELLRAAQGREVQA